MSPTAETDTPWSLRVLFREDDDHNVQSAPEQNRCSTLREARDAGEDWLDDLEVEAVCVKHVDDDSAVFVNVKSQSDMGIWIDEEDIDEWDE
jgi:hypothetical protein